MKIYKAYKTEIKPNKAQEVLLRKACGVARFAWNWGLARRIEVYKKEKKTLSAYDQQKELTAIKKTEFPWMYEVSKCAPEQALVDLQKGFENFFRRVKNGHTPGFPKFKAKHRTTPSFTVKQSSSGRWFVSVLVKEEVSEPKRLEAAPIGVDLGLTKCGLEIDRDLNAAINLANYVPPDRRESTPALLNEGCKRVRGRKFRKRVTDGASVSPELLAGV